MTRMQTTRTTPGRRSLKLSPLVAFVAMRRARRFGTVVRTRLANDDDDDTIPASRRPPSHRPPPGRSSLLTEHAMAALAFGFLVSVAVSKTLLTKLVFSQLPAPVAFSVLSCVATNVCLAPCLLYSGQLRPLAWRQLPRFLAVCLAVAVDLACTNVALAILTVALQQCLKATSPTATIIVESLLRRKRFHPAIYAVVLAICVGPLLVVRAGVEGLPAANSAVHQMTLEMAREMANATADATSTADAAVMAAATADAAVAAHTAVDYSREGSVGSQAFGMLMMMAAVVGGAFKYVLAHRVIVEYREQVRASPCLRASDGLPSVDGFRRLEKASDRFRSLLIASDRLRWHA